MAELNIRHETYCESIPWGCDFGTNLYQVDQTFMTNSEYYVYVKKTTLITECRHGDRNTGMTPQTPSDGRTYFLFFVKNLKTGKKVCYRDWDISGDLEKIKDLNRDLHISEDTYVVGDVSDSCFDSDDEEDGNTGKEVITINEVISGSLEEFLNLFLHHQRFDPRSHDIIVDKFNDVSKWNKVVYLDPNYLYNQDYWMKGEEPVEQWYDVFIHAKKDRTFTDCADLIRVPFSLGPFKINVTADDGTWTYENPYPDASTETIATQLPEVGIEIGEESEEDDIRAA
jgi:hypothetical protein